MMALRVKKISKTLSQQSNLLWKPIYFLLHFSGFSFYFCIFILWSRVKIFGVIDPPRYRRRYLHSHEIETKLSSKNPIKLPANVYPLCNSLYFLQVVIPCFKTCLLNKPYGKWERQKKNSQKIMRSNMVIKFLCNNTWKHMFQSI